MQMWPAPSPSTTTTATFVVDETLRVLSADGPGRSILDQAMGLRLSLGRLCTGSQSANAQLRANILRDQASGEMTLATDNGDNLTMSVVPLAALDGEASDRRQGIVMLHLAPANADLFAAVQAGCGLTSAETDVLRLIYKGLNTVEVAGALGIAKTTVRTHLHHVFAKTDTSRQSELVHFVVTYRPDGARLPAG